MWSFSKNGINLFLIAFLKENAVYVVQCIPLD